MNHKHHNKKAKIIKEVILIIIGLGVFFSAVFLFWIATVKLPDFSDFESRKITNSTKIYDKTGKVLLYNIHDNIKRTQVKNEDISDNIKRATVAIEDAHFYEHYGIRPTSILRAVWVNFTTGGYTQGGSTITQQVIKNSLLTPEKTIIRKMKEWVLAIKLDYQVSKDDILNIYLNESPYGGSTYGVEEASLAYFDKHAKDVDLTEAAYLAAMPQAPSRYSPYGKNLALLEARKNLVLQRMLDLNFITKEQFDVAMAEKVEFNAQENSNGKALHFIFFVREYLEEKYGKDEVENGGLKIVTSLDWEMQKNAEEIVKTGSLENQKKYKASNAALVAIDPKTGQILSMVGSRDYFDKTIDGNYNIATALRQPGSAFKPIVYALAFMKGFTPSTVLFDLPTQFSTSCDAYGNPLPQYPNSKCYMPVNYDGNFQGPISLRNALQLSLNIPAVKLLYLVGIQNTLSFAKSLGLTSLADLDSRFGLSLVLGGGEISLLELTNVYATFANNGIHNKISFILEVTDKDGNVLEKYTPDQTDVIPEAVTNTLANVLSDNNARVPEYGVNNPLFFGERPVAVKTGTTNDYKDVWVFGYTPSIAVGMWSGNNNNVPIDKKIAGFVVAPVWHKFMDKVFEGTPIEYFKTPEPVDNNILPVLRGVYCQGNSFGTILNYMGGNGGKGGVSDPQYSLWDIPIQIYAQTHTCPFGGSDPNSESSSTAENVPVIDIPITVVP